MSSNYYNQNWEQAISNLLETIEEENQPLNQNKIEKGITYKRSDYQWFQYYAALYLRYLETYRKLQDSYDQMIHPQKRILMKQMLDNTMVRMCEVKQNIVRYSTHTNIIQSDFVNIDQILQQMKLTPKALHIPLPRFVHDNKTARDITIQKIVKQQGITQQIQQIHDRVTLDTNLETAIRIIQKLQRGRQGIVRGLQFSKLKNKLQKDRSSDIDNQQEQRAIIVQKYWRAFLGRKKTQKMRQQEMKFLGIEKQSTPKGLLQSVQKQRQKMKILQRSKQQTFEKDKEKLRNQIKKTEEPTIKAKMLDDRRKWIQMFLQMHEFTNLPTKAQDYYKKKQLKSDQQKPEKKDKKPKQKKEEQKGGKGKKNEVEKFLDEHIEIGPTQQVIRLQQRINQYNQVWGDRDPTEVTNENYNVQLAKDQLRPDIQDQLQKMIDGIINLQLDNMRIKYGIKKKKEKKPKRKPKKQKKVKIPQGLSKKDPKQILEELFEKNIAKLLSSAKMDDFLGQHNTVTYMIQKNAEQLPDPALSQVRNLVAEYIGLPLSSQYAKDKLQKWNWFLFYGATGTGKTLLLRALHKQTNALVFDLTPEIVKEKYAEKAQLTRLIWSTIICAKQFQPSIIMIDDFQTIFSGVKAKKNSGTPSFGPKMKKVIGDMKKNKLWTKNDQIAVIACTNKPYDASIKDMKKLFDKKMYFPYPNYATRKLMIKHFIEQKVGHPLNDFPYETFAHVTEGFTAGSFRTTVDKVLTPMRIQRLKDDPLKINELVNPLANSICVFAEQYEKIRKFTDEVTGLKERREAKNQPNKSDGNKDKKKQQNKN